MLFSTVCDMSYLLFFKQVIDFGGLLALHENAVMISFARKSS